MKPKTFFLTTYSILVLFIFSCIPKKNNTTDDILNLLILQSLTSKRSPSCVAVVRGSATLFQAIGTDLEGENCSYDYLVPIKAYTDATEARNEYVRQVDEVIAVHTAAGNGCLASQASAVAQKATARTQIAGTGGFVNLATIGSGCIYIGASDSTSIQEYGSSYTGNILYCTSESNKNNYLNSRKAKYKFFQGPKVIEDMAQNWRETSLLAQGTTSSGYRLSRSAAQALRLYTQDEYDTMRTKEGRAVESGDENCRAAIYAQNQKIKRIKVSSSTSGTTQDKAAITEALTPSLSCVFGSSSVSSIISFVGACPSKEPYVSF